MRCSDEHELFIIDMRLLFTPVSQGEINGLHQGNCTEVEVYNN